MEVCGALRNGKSRKNPRRASVSRRLSILLEYMDCFFLPCGGRKKKRGGWKGGTRNRQTLRQSGLRRQADGRPGRQRVRQTASRQTGKRIDITNLNLNLFWFLGRGINTVVERNGSKGRGEERNEWMVTYGNAFSYPWCLKFITAPSCIRLTTFFLSLTSPSVTEVLEVRL